MVQRRVLIVDDIPINCKILCMHLGKFDIPADTASNGEEAVAACMKTRYSIVLMDLDMPVMDGYTATKLIRKFEHSLAVRTPILAVSSFDKPDDRQRCIREGLDGLIKKGLKAEELLAVINSYDLEDTGSRFPSILVQRAVTEQLGMTADMAQMQFRFEGKTTEIVAEFNMFARLKTIDFERAIADRNAMALTQVAYALKGACSNLGLSTMAAFSAEIADDGYASRWNKVSRKYRRLLEMLDSVQESISHGGGVSTTRVS